MDNADTITPRNLEWLAGLLEGEGTFTQTTDKVPVIAVEMTDEDPIDKASKIVGYPYYQTRRTSAGKPCYRVTLRGAPAVGWMMTLYGLMGIRRRKRIREIIDEWKLQKPEPARVWAHARLVGARNKKD